MSHQNKPIQPPIAPTIQAYQDSDVSDAVNQCVKKVDHPTPNTQDTWLSTLCEKTVETLVHGHATLETAPNLALPVAQAAMVSATWITERQNAWRSTQSDKPIETHNSTQAHPPPTFSPPPMVQHSKTPTSPVSDFLGDPIDEDRPPLPKKQPPEACVSETPIALPAIFSQTTLRKTQRSRLKKKKGKEKKNKEQRNS